MTDDDIETTYRHCIAISFPYEQFLNTYKKKYNLGNQSTSEIFRKGLDLLMQKEIEIEKYLTNEKQKSEGENK